MHRLIRIGLITTLVLATFLVASPFRSGVQAATPDYEPGQIVVKLASLLGNDLIGINRAYGTTTLASLPDHSDIFLLQAPLGVDARQLVQAMRNDVRLVYAELNYINESPEDGGTNRTYGWGGFDSSTMQSQDSARNLRIEEAHTLGRGGGTLVAILDTGVQSDHPALSNSLDPLGYDFVDNDLAPEEEANGVDDDGDGRIDELYGHGTHVAGIVHLVAPDARLLPLRVLNSDGRGNNFRTASAIVYAAHRGADAINLSLGTPNRSALLREVVSEAAGLGAVVVAAAGNLNTDAKQYPAAEACAIAVTSVSANDKKSSFANYGDWIGVAAPGESIYSAFPIDGYAWWSGTSMATPFVAGQAALLRGVNPQLTLDEVGLLIGGTSDSVDRMNPAYRGRLGEGRIDLLASLESLVADTWPTQEHNVSASCGH
jgi:subtilisin family serine protease